MRLVVAVVVWTSVWLAQGCGESLGKCDPGQIDATSVTMPHAGQMLVNQTCAAGRCHSARAKGDDRVGVPAGLNFDVVPLSEAPSELALVERNAKRVREMAEEMWAWIQDGTMPPEGQRAPPTAAQKETMRNWLACDAPIVPKPAADDPRHPWRSIFVRLTSRYDCLSCHGSAPNAGAGFEFSASGDACEAYDNVVDQMTVAGSDGNCAGNEYVQPGTPDASVLLQKLEAPLCGGVMPPTNPIPIGSEPIGGGAQLAADLRDWIESGAEKPPDCP